MGTFRYENQGSNTYLIYALEEKEVIDTMSLGMLMNNSILGLAPAQYTQMNASRFIRYNISSKIVIKDFFSESANKKRLLGVFYGIINAMLSAEDYMINPDAIIMDPSFIFSDVTTCETVLICVPVLEMTQKKADLRAFFKNIMFSTQFDKTEGYDYVGEIINYLNSGSVFSLLEFKAVLDNIAGERSSSSAQQVPQVQQVLQKPLQISHPEENLRFAPQPKPSVQPQNNGNMNGTRELPSVCDSFVQPPNQVVRTPLVNPPAEVQKVDNGEKPMSMFYLLQHYNKENAELYKAQKATQKSKKMSKETSKQVGFAVPGQQAGPQEFSIPGNVQQTVSQPASVSQPSASPWTEKKQLNQSSDTPASTSGVNMDFGDTVIAGTYDEDPETEVYGQDSMEQRIVPHLLRRKNNERILINKAIFRLGRDVSFNDYVIADNKFVGHGHCHIITRGGEYFIVDDNSKNHTYVDGTAIPPSSEIKLSHGQNVRLSDEEFEFRLF